ncbi:MAG: hypothetical protein U0168_31775 [Nannocystaceae bacterium]|jgi:hypothetical protein
MTHRDTARWVLLGLGLGGVLSTACIHLSEEGKECEYDIECMQLSTPCSKGACIEGVCKSTPTGAAQCDGSTGDLATTGLATTGDPATTSATDTTPPETTGEPTTASGPEDTTSADPDSTTTGGGGDGVCGSDHHEGSPEVDACVTESCCAEFDACVANPDCVACLASDPPAKGCFEQEDFGAYQNCAFNGCQATLCNSPLVIEDRGGGIDFDCHECMYLQCCGQAQFCLADPVACAWCLDEEDPLAPQSPQCQGATLEVQQGAQLIHDCVASFCAAECETL